MSLEVAQGSITCLLGPNGAGKTTLMMTIAGVLKPQARLDPAFADREIAGAGAARASSRAGIALVPENRLVFPSMTVLENLHAGAYQRKTGVSTADIERMFARFPRLKERAQQLAGTLSGGEQQMLAVARALMSRPKLLLMDEPSLGLAPLVVEEIFRIIARAAPRRRHDLPRRAERPHGAQGGAALLPDGAGPGDLQRRPRLARRGRGHPAGVPRLGAALIDFVQNTLDGLAAGASYALLAVGFTLIFGVLRRANLSYGPAIMLGAYAATWVFLQYRRRPARVVAVVAVGGTVVGGNLRRAALLRAAPHGAPRPPRWSRASRVWMQLEELATLVLPRHLYAFPALYEGAAARRSDRSFCGSNLW